MADPARSANSRIRTATHESALRAIEPGKVFELLGVGASVQLIDVRKRADWAVSRIFRAQHITSYVASEALIVLYDEDGSGSGFSSLAEMIELTGAFVVSLRGGIAGWCDEGFPLHRSGEIAVVV